MESPYTSGHRNMPPIGYKGSTDFTVVQFTRTPRVLDLGFPRENEKSGPHINMSDSESDEFVESLNYVSDIDGDMEDNAESEDSVSLAVSDQKDSDSGDHSDSDTESDDVTNMNDLVGSISVEPDSSSEANDTLTKTYNNVTISLIKAEIKDQQVDVIVNSTSASLDLTQGTASRALLQAAGDSIQQECTNNYPEGISDTTIAMTGGGNLKCKKVYHISLQKWRGDRNKKVLESLVSKCLKKASSDGMSAIAIPALGTGLLNYDRDMVARRMFSCVKHFAGRNTDTNLKDVRFVIFPSDSMTFGAFERRLKGRSRDTDTSERVVQTTKVGQIEVKLVTGKLTEQQCDIVMTTCTRKLELSKGTLSQSVLDAAGSSLQTECTTKYPNGIQHGEIAVLSPGNMSCKKIHCGALPRFDKPPEGSNPKQILTKVVHASLKEASNDNHVSVCFPTLGTGYLKYKPEVSANLMFMTIQDFALKNGNSALRTVMVVIHSTEETMSKLLEPFKSQHSQVLTSGRPVPTPRPRSSVGTSSSKPKPKIEKTSPQASYSPKPIVDIEHLSPPLPPKPSKPAQEKPSKPLPNSSVNQPVGKEPRSKSTVSHRKSFAEKFLSGKDISKIGQQLIKDPSELYVRRKPPPVIIDEEEKKEEEVFCVDGAMALPARSTPEYCLHMFQIEIFPPAYWTTYTDKLSVKKWIVNEKGKQGYKIIDVTGSLFKSVVKLVEGTWLPDKVGHGRDAKGLDGLGYTHIKVTKVQRIENLKLYETYRQRQQSLFHKAGEGPMFKKLSETNAKFGNPKTDQHLDPELKDTLQEEVNEGYFFHGTKGKNVEGLIKDGIDPRLAAGQAVFGKGIYLAESSTKADQYADERGDTRKMDNLKMFLVRCNLGNICLMKTVKKFNRPPCCVADCLQDGCAHDNRYDSIVEEEKYIFREFVVYEGNLSYPEYLITYNRV